jgi:hypothetical protein
MAANSVIGACVFRKYFGDSESKPQRYSDPLTQYPELLEVWLRKIVQKANE